MKQKLRGLFAAVWIAVPAMALPCIPGSLQDYVNLGPAGCTVAGSYGNVLFNNFAPEPGAGSATPIPLNAILVTPITQGLRFSVTGNNGPGEFDEAFFGFNVSQGLLALFTLALSNAQATIDGAVIGTLEGCTGADFLSPGNCPGAPFNLATLVVEGASVPTDSAPISPASSFFDVFVTLDVDGGLLGTASAGSLDVTFSDVPEPSSALLFIGGAAMLALLRLPRN